MTRQPSTRTAEPRTHHDPNTAAGRLEVFIRANANRGGMNDLAGWLSDLDKIVNIIREQATLIAAEYARLQGQRDDEKDGQ